MAETIPEHRTGFATRSGDTRVIGTKSDETFRSVADARAAAGTIQTTAQEAKVKAEAGSGAKKASAKPDAPAGGPMPPSTQTN
ncbi:hypothetical protein [Croceicoccus naphthovorans]|uniref:Uncharacterized protein n=1 Tax=Croceicoccus naphthovorans TaxID=1348774 RepID=A0A0G3XGW2_9SPHN|nr:hypothetical protein [Croceicoccus naphthovorans]AKM09876.1 hypothetical protein AB433_07580 [Croceicoccus naphthovorans]MBB3991335.1 hypothetical protein [Croceicoccus naphthovorans]